jgi:hypothetical protein
MEDREWMGFHFLREALHESRQQFDGRLYPISAADSEIDSVRRTLYLAALVDAFPARVIEAFRRVMEGQPVEQQRKALREVEELYQMTRAAEYHVAKASHQVGELLGQLHSIRSQDQESEHAR